MSAVLPTAQRLTVTQQTFFPFTPFTAPNPAPNTGVHRFIYALYTQPPNFNTVGFQSVGMELQTANWNVSTFFPPGGMSGERGLTWNPSSRGGARSWDSDRRLARRFSALIPGPMAGRA